LLFDVEKDAIRTFDLLQGGGTAIVPTHVGYAFVGITEDAIHRTFVAKQRAPGKLHAFTGCAELHAALHIVDERAEAVLQTIWRTYGLTLGCVAPARLDHPMMKKLPASILSQSINDGTVAMLLGAGPFLDVLGRLSHEHEIAVIGSSANLSQRGVKYRVEDIEPEILEAADLVIDYGLMRWACYAFSSTMIDVRDFSVVRYGACFDLIQDILRRHFDIDLADRPASA
jgi:tRNA A37 threonylcarbamoyladenosine synthetase subunit TsaC/SUA5/YrdC